MKKTIRQLMNILLVGLLLSAATTNAQSLDANPIDSVSLASSFEVATYMGANWTMNLMLAVHQPTGATITIRNADDTVLYQQYLKKSRIVYHHKFMFDECKPGVYRVVISDGRQTVIRRVEVVNIPAIESQRYITFGSQTNL